VHAARHRIGTQQENVVMHSTRFLAPVLLLTSMTAPAMADTAREAFWSNLSSLCGKAFAGALTRLDAEMDAQMSAAKLVIHVTYCSDTEIHIPFHVGEDRSRTWVVTRTDDGFRLKHDHRHEDGREDDVTWYGGHSTDPGRPYRQTFPADAYSRALFLSRELDVSIGNYWNLEVRPGEVFAYELVRSGRFLRAEFDLTETIAAPPPAWGHE
jgi:hypothetical protein